MISACGCERVPVLTPQTSPVARAHRLDMIEPPTQAASCSPGSLRIAAGAALFACTNAAATALYRRGGASVVSLYVIRSPIVYVANVMLVALQDGMPQRARTPG